MINYPFTHILKVTKLFCHSICSSFINNIHKIVSQNKGHPFSAHTKFLLKMTEDMSKVDVKQLQ